MHSERFSKSDRLRKQAEFTRVYDSNVYAADDVLVITAVANGKSFSRLGLSVSRQVGNAVVRNRWKRLIRESFRRRRTSIPAGLDLVVRPRKDAVCQLDKIEKSLIQLAKRIGRRVLTSSKSSSRKSP